MTATSLWYIGADRWREWFTDALGAVFEAYVGDQLRLMKNVQLLGQVHYTSQGSDARSCDWIVVTDEVVVLVEVKCARPTLDYRTGGAEGLADAARKLGEGVGQIERTATQIADRHPAFSHIPATDRLAGSSSRSSPTTFVKPCVSTSWTATSSRSVSSGPTSSSRA